MGRMILFVVLLASAASAQPVRPPAPVFVPSQDAPHTVGQPGHVRPDVDYPRSPHKRVLPPEKGPGIWAGDEPKTDTGPVTVLGERLPQPEYETPEAREPMKRCAEFFLGGILSVDGLGLEVYRAPPKLRRCALFDALKACLDTSDRGRAILKHMSEAMMTECTPPPNGMNELAAKIESAAIRAADGNIGGGTPQ